MLVSIALQISPCCYFVSPKIIFNNTIILFRVVDHHMKFQNPTFNDASVAVPEKFATLYVGCIEVRN